MKFRAILACFLVLAACAAGAADGWAAETKGPSNSKEPPSISVSQDLDQVLVKEAAQVKADMKKQALSLFGRQPLGWDLKTIDYLTEWALNLPLRLPELLAQVLAQGRVLGIAGSLAMLTFIVAVLYSLIGQKRVMRRIVAGIEPVRPRIPENAYPLFLAAVRVVVAAAIPLLLLGAYELINALIDYKAIWFALTGRLLLLWAAASLVIGLLKELLTRGLFPVTTAHGRTMFQLTRLVLLYVLVGIALLWAAEAFGFRKDVLAFLRFAISVSVVCVFALLVLKKRALLSFLPELPYSGYQRFTRALDRFFYPLIGLSFVLALLWCFGFRELGRVVLVKIWATAGALLLLTLVYHVLRNGLARWSEKMPPADDSAHYLVDSLRSFLRYAAIVATVALLLNMLGLLGPLERLLSFPVVELGESVLTFWTIIKAALVVLFFVYAARLLQAYLDYKIYPALGVVPGLGFAINTIVRYGFLALGFLIALRTVGVDLRFLLVFAGAIGIGIGLGLQNMAASLLAGFTIIFGGKIRKGDWIEVEGNLGVVTDIHLLATRVRTRANVEYLVPNATLVSNTIVNYSLTSPMIWIAVPVGVSYGADPRQVEKILLEVGRREPMVSKQNAPRVIFTEFADSSLNFSLLAWIDVRQNAERLVKSALYFAIFEEFAKAGIEIPFPQRDIHIRSVAGKEDITLADAPLPEPQGPGTP
jgi:small-conductance mechanosensitive channel